MSKTSVADLMKKTSKPSSHETATFKVRPTHILSNSQDQSSHFTPSFPPPQTLAKSSDPLKPETHHVSQNSSNQNSNQSDPSKTSIQSSIPISFKQMRRQLLQQEQRIPEIRRVTPSNKELKLSDNVKEHISHWKDKYVSWLTVARLHIPKPHDVDPVTITEIERLIESGIMPTVSNIKNMDDKKILLQYLSSIKEPFDQVTLAWLFSLLLVLDRYITNPPIALFLSQILSKLIEEINNLSPNAEIFPYLCVNYITITDFFVLSSYLK